MRASEGRDCDDDSDYEPCVPHLAAYDNSWYRPGRRSSILAWLLISRLFFQTRLPWPYSLKRSLLRLFGARIGRGVVIKQRVTVKYPWFFVVADDSWIGEDVWVDNLCGVEIGSNCCVSQGAYLGTGNHNFKSVSFDLMLAPVVLEDGSWVGARAVMCPGAKLKSGAVLTVGSVLSSVGDINGVYSGVPARKVSIRAFAKDGTTS